uniref:Thrombospondin type laminin G domain and EAR repeats n=1 Tax=Cynoglossus semilaevis TaxID=244447 RepID=A0A3P8UVC4_CYNSE
MFQTLQEVLTLRLGITVLQRSCGKKGGKPTLLTSLFPPLFSDMLPLDLLSFVLERDPSKLQAGGVRGVHFSSPHSSLSFPSSQLLANCDLFPKEFSIVVTLKVTHIAQKVNICGNPDIVTEEQLSVALERSCSDQLQGQLWFNPVKKGLYLCDGTGWITVLEDRKRLDYVQEHQVLTTSSETHDIEVFQVPGMGLMAAMAHRSKASGSAVYLWTHSRFKLYQNISTHEALAWRHFNIGKKVFLVVSNSGGGTYNRFESQMEFSVIYKWSKKRKQFVRFQSLQTFCARDWEAFTINRQNYLAVANHRLGNNNHTINSVIYKWNRTRKSFEIHQLLPTSGAYDWEFFTVGPYHFLVVANAFNGVTTSVDSVIYVWVNGRFQPFQTIKTFCATDWEMFQIGSRVFLVVANGHRLHGNEPSRYAINSTIYELDMKGQIFVRFQDIITYSALDWEFFSLGEEHFLIVANSFNGESYSLNSILYRWQGYEGFVPIHWLPTIGCSDWEFFTSKGDSYLIYSSAKAPLSKVFRLKTY